MSDTLAYSAPYAKIKCLARDFFDDKDYTELMSKKTVGELASYLKNNTAYSEVLRDVKESLIHRGELEGIIKSANLSDFIKIAHFLTGERRKFLSIYVVKFEIDSLKFIMRCINSGEDVDNSLQVPDYYRVKSKLDFSKLTTCETMSDLIKSLYLTPYYELMSSFFGKDKQHNMFTLEVTLDIYYYKYLYKMIKKCLSGQDQRLAMLMFGTEIDLLNILWIYRCKKFYNAAKEIIYSYLIPVNYKLNKAQIMALVEAANVSEFVNTLASTHYRDAEIKEDTVFNEQSVGRYLYTIIERQYHENPFTIAKIIAHFHLKQVEINNMIKIIEGIRYRLDPMEIQKYLIKK